MVALLEAMGKFGLLAAEGVHASEERRAQILAEADASYRAYRENLTGFWAGLAKDDAEMAALAKPLPPPRPPAQPAPSPPAPAPAAQPPTPPPAQPPASPPAGETGGVFDPQPSGTE